MTRLERHIRLLVIAALTTTATTSATLALAEDARPVGIEEMVVTARHAEERAQSVPIPITAATGEQLQDRAAFEIAELERITPNLSFQNSAVAKNSANIFLRGIGQTNWGPAQDPKVGVYQNGVYIGRPQGNMFDLLDVERVEVLRGPQGTLFGRNTTAGLVQIITRSPTDEMEADVKVGAGTNEQFLVSGILNVPVSDTLAARVAIQHREREGFIRNRFDDSDWNDENSWNGRGTVEWTPSDSFTATFGADYQRVREKPSLATCRFLGPENGATAGGLEFFAWVFGAYDSFRTNCMNQSAYESFEDDPNDNSEIDQYGLAMTLVWDIEGIGEITSITAYRNMEEINGSWGFIGDSALGSVLEIQQPDGKTNNFDQISQELRISSTAFDDRLTWQAGVYFFEENAEQYFAVPLFRNMVAPDCAVVPQFCAGGLGGIAQFLQVFASNNLDYDANNKSRAVYGEFTYRVTDAIAVTAGIRYTEDERELSLVQTLLNGATDAGYRCPPDRSVLPVNNKCSRETGSLDETTPRVIVSWQATDDVLLYASWSKGYSSGGLNQTPRLEDYLPETSKNWELGFKSDLFDRRLRLNMTTFHNSYENQQESVGRLIDNQPVVAILNAQEATLWGVEAELTVAPADGWLITAVGGYTHGEYDEFSVIDVAIGPPPLLEEIVSVRDLSDTKVIRGSPYTYSVSVSRTMALDDEITLAANIGWSYRARRFDSLEAPKFTRQDPYGLLDARVTLNWRNAGLSFWGTNLLDKQYTASRGGAPADNIQRVYWAPPRMMGLELTWSFDD